MKWFLMALGLAAALGVGACAGDYYDQGYGPGYYDRGGYGDYRGRDDYGRGGYDRGGYYQDRGGYYQDGGDDDQGPAARSR